MLRIENLTINFGKKVILENVSDTFENCCFHLIQGLSGSGKSSYLYRLSLMNKEKNYRYYWNDLNVLELKDEEKSELIRNHVGFVLQENDVMEALNVKENILQYSSLINQTLTDEEIIELMNKVELHVPLHQDVKTLSGGEKQRLAIACALAKSPKILLLDEPTNALDEKNEIKIFEILKKLAHEEHLCVIVASHSYLALSYADKIHKIENKKLVCSEFINNEEIQVNQSSQKLKKNFYLNYLKTFFKQYKTMHLLQVFLVLICIFGVLSAQRFTNIYAYKAIDALIDKDTLFFVVTSEPEHKTLSSIEKTMSSSQKEIVHNLENVEVHPLGKVYTSDALTKTTAIVYPYYTSGYMKDKLQSRYELTDRKGTYLSDELYLQMADYYSNFSHVDAHIAVFNENAVKEEDIHYFVQGTNAQNFVDYYSSESVFMYMHYEQYEKLLGSNDIYGYVVKASSLQDFKKALNSIQNEEMGLNDQFFKLEKVEVYLHLIELLQICSIGVLCVLMIILWNLLFTNIFEKRKFEFAILNINGINKKTIFKIIAYDFGIKTSVSLISAILLYFLVWKEMFSLVTLLVVLISFCVFQFVYTKQTLKNLHSDEILRN